MLGLLASGMAGCLLFTDPINTAPTVSFPPQTEPLKLVRSKTAFTVDAFDPDQSTDSLRFDWYQGKTCDEALAGPPAAPNVVGNVPFPFQPTKLGSGCVVVVVTDNRGATASAAQSYEVVDQAPTASIVIPYAAGQPEPVSGQPYPLALYSTVTLSGKVDDPDSEDIDFLTPIWRVFIADGTQLSLPACPDNSKGPLVCTFTTTTPGSYRVELVVNDKILASDPAEQFIQVAGDQLPNIVLDSAQPLPPTSSNNSPLLLLAAQNNAFAINRVEDDGDPYPPVEPLDPNSPSPAGFVWYVRLPSSPLFERCIGGGPSFTLGKTFNPQDIVQVRVEYHDRVTACQPRTPGCDAVFAACDPNATICYSPDYRVQWVTWTVEFR